jgi:hypothetical protein
MRCFHSRRYPGRVFPFALRICDLGRLPRRGIGRRGEPHRGDVERRGFGYEHVPPPDVVPATMEQVEHFVRLLQRVRREEKGAVFVHCGCDCGSIGIMFACFLVSESRSGEETMRERRRLQPGVHRDRRTGRDRPSLSETRAGLMPARALTASRHETRLPTGAGPDILAGPSKARDRGVVRGSRGLWRRAQTSAAPPGSGYRDSSSASGALAVMRSRRSRR